MKQNLRKSWGLLTVPNSQNKTWAIICLIALFFNTTDIEIFVTILCMVIIGGIIVNEYRKYLLKLERQRMKFIIDEVKKELKIDANVTVNKFVNLGDMKER